MQKIPTLFKRQFENHKVVSISSEVTEGFEWVLNGEGEATIKWDGACCALLNDQFCRRYDAKKGKTPPEGAIPCQVAPDPETGHWPHWVVCSEKNPADKWFWEAYWNFWSTDSLIMMGLGNWTYEAIGPHFQGNPYNRDTDILIPHGLDVVKVERSFEGIRKFLTENEVEGLVFWREMMPQCKIKRKDFGLPWPVK